MKIAAGFILMLIIFADLWGQGIPYGKEFLINTNIYNNPGNPKIAASKNGNFLVCWMNEDPDRTGYDIIGQLFDSNGNKIGSEFRVNTSSQGYQADHSVAATIDGGFVVCWVSHEGDFSVLGQFVDANGNKKGNEFKVNTHDQGNVNQTGVAVLKNGDFVVCWQGEHYLDDSTWGIFAQIFNASGAKKGTEFQVNTIVDGQQETPVIAALSGGGFVVCWVEPGICAQVFNASGKKIGSQLQIGRNYYLIFPVIDALSDGGFVVCWNSADQDWSNYKFWGQLFDASGNKRGDEFEVNDALAGPPSSVLKLATGRFVVCWWHLNQFDVDGELYGQLFSENGVKIWKHFQINNYTYGSQGTPVAASLGDAGFVICWWGFYKDGCDPGIVGKRFPSEPIIHQLQEFSLIAPANDTTIDVIPPFFKWQQPGFIRECYSYEITFNLYIDTDINFSNPKIIRDIQDTTYTIDSLAAGKTYFWKVLAKNLAGDSLWSKQQDWGFFIKQGATLVEDAEIEVPQNFELYQNYPNPFNSTTEIKYSLPSGKASYQVQLKIYDVLGRLVKVLVDQAQSAGSYAIRWDGTDLRGNRVASGVYLYSLEAGLLKSIHKMLLLQ